MQHHTFKSLAEVLSGRPTGLIVFEQEGRYFKQVVCSGCPDCVVKTEEGFTKEYPHYQSTPQEIFGEP